MMPATAVTTELHGRQQQLMTFAEIHEKIF
jgi:hypothetical protein